MILLYYANYAVAAHGQWCILMAIVAQRGAIAIDQSCSGYANSSSTWRTRKARRGRGRLIEDDRNVEIDNDEGKTILLLLTESIYYQYIIIGGVFNITVIDIEFTIRV